MEDDAQYIVAKSSDFLSVFLTRAECNGGLLRSMSTHIDCRLICADESIKKLKGFCRPHNNQEDRKKVLEALDCVDEVIIFDEDTPYELIRKLQPDIITKGGDYKKEDVVGNDLADVRIIPFIEGYSTTKTLEYMNGDC